jgi:hypothetical protein
MLFVIPGEPFRKDETGRAILRKIGVGLTLLDLAFYDRTP